MQHARQPKERAPVLGDRKRPGSSRYSTAFLTPSSLALNVESRLSIGANRGVGFHDPVLVGILTSAAITHKRDLRHGLPTRRAR